MFSSNSYFQYDAKICIASCSSVCLSTICLILDLIYQFLYICFLFYSPRLWNWGQNLKFNVYRILWFFDLVLLYKEDHCNTTQILDFVGNDVNWWMNTRDLPLSLKHNIFIRPTKNSAFKIESDRCKWKWNQVFYNFICIWIQNLQTSFT